MESHFIHLRVASSENLMLINSARLDERAVYLQLQLRTYSAKWISPIYVYNGIN